MPSDNFGTILLRLYFADEQNRRRTGPVLRYPWCYPSFRASIGYPPDDGLPMTYDPFAPGAQNTLPGFSDQEFLHLQAYVTAFGRVGRQGSSKTTRPGQINALRHDFAKKNPEDTYDAARKLATDLGRKTWWDSNDFNQKIDRAFKEEGIHPLQRLSEMTVALKNGPFDIPNRERSRLLDIMVEVLFGDDAYTEQGSRMAYPAVLDDDLELILQIILNRYSKNKKRLIKQYSSRKTKADNAMSGVSFPPSLSISYSSIATEIEQKKSMNEKITMKMIRGALDATERLIEATHCVENDISVRNNLDIRIKELGDLLDSLSSTKLNNRGTRTSTILLPISPTDFSPSGFSGLSCHHFESSATLTEIESFNSIFLSLTTPNTVKLSSLIPSDDLVAQHGDDHLQSMAGQLLGTDDMGVERFASMSPESIRAELGWFNGFDAPSFQPFRRIDGTTAWSHPTEFANLDTTNPIPPTRFVQQRAKWVQLCGIASIIPLIFTEAKGPKPEGILLADEVGVGKTLHSAGVSAFINQIIQGRAAGIPDPPILS